jgi:hypothetical protein
VAAIHVDDGIVPFVSSLSFAIANQVFAGALTNFAYDTTLLPPIVPLPRTGTVKGTVNGDHIAGSCRRMLTRRALLT